MSKLRPEKQTVVKFKTRTHTYKMRFEPPFSLNKVKQLRETIDRDAPLIGIEAVGYEFAVQNDLKYQITKRLGGMDGRPKIGRAETKKAA